MTNYTLKDPTPIGREYMVEKFNLAFNMNINYGFFKNKLDEFKKAYKRWKELMKCTGISVDPETSMIYASEEWWNARELGCKITSKFKRQPPEYWDVMQRCFVLHDVSSQPQNSSRQRREEMMNEGLDDDALHGYSDNDGSDMHQTQVPETQMHEEVYRVSVNDDTHPSNEFVRDTFRVPDGRAEQRNRVNSQSTVRRGNSSHRSGGSSGTNVGSGSRGNRRRQSFEATIQDTITGYREFQRQSLQQLRPGGFDQEDYDEFKKAEAIFLALQLPKKTKFYWACIDSLKELRFWRRYFIDIAGGTDEDKIELLEAMTSVSRNDQDLPKRLGSDHSYGSPHSTSPGYQQWDTPPNPPQWGTPPNPPQWGTPPNPPQWGTPPNPPQWGTPPNAPQWSSPPNPPQWGSSPNASHWGLPPNFQPWGSPSNFHPWGHTPNFQQGGSSGTTPTNVQYGFSVGGQEESMRNTPQEVSHGATMETSPNVQHDSSSGLGFTNYFDTAQISQTPRPGGLFNIWGTTQGATGSTNEDHQSDSGDED